jgi:hypothetical protein
VPPHKGKFARANLGHGDGAWKLSGTKAKPNAQVNRRQCEALTSELNLQLGWCAKERALRTRMPVFRFRCLAGALMLSL